MASPYRRHTSSRTSRTSNKKQKKRSQNRNTSNSRRPTSLRGHYRSSFFNRQKKDTDIKGEAVNYFQTQLNPITSKIQEIKQDLQVSSHGSSTEKQAKAKQMEIEAFLNMAESVKNQFYDRIDQAKQEFDVSKSELENKQGQLVSDATTIILNIGNASKQAENDQKEALKQAKNDKKEALKQAKNDEKKAKDAVEKARKVQLAYSDRSSKKSRSRL